MRKPTFFLLSSILGAIIPASALTLYDASLGTLPSAQSWVSGTQGTIAYQGMGTRIATLPDFGNISVISTEFTLGGIGQHPYMPVLNRTDGFEVSFSLQVLSEMHNTSRDDNADGLLDRAGFSVLILSEDLRGIEIAFFENKIWVYEDDKTIAGDKFTQAENVHFDTTKFTYYKLTGTADGYSLLADGVSILSGQWRIYHPSGVEPLKDPYDNPSAIFIADNTQSASSDVLLGDVSVEIGPFPEPMSAAYPVPIPLPALIAFLGLLLFSAIRFISHSEQRLKA